MNKKICVLLALSLLMPACMRKKASVHKITQKTQAYDENLGQKTTYDENVGAFVLEDEAGHDIFSEAKDIKKTDIEKDGKEGKDKNDLDDAWAWQELDENQITQVVHFDWDSARIRPDQESTLKYDAQQAKVAVEDGATVVIEGHACLITRSQIYNQALSQKRADAVKKRLITLGVPAKSIKAVGRGTSFLITQAEGKEGQSPNRRAEIKFIYPRGEKTVSHKKVQKAVVHATKGKVKKSTKVKHASKVAKTVKTAKIAA